jgi:hypothetical protein
VIWADEDGDLMWYEIFPEPKSLKPLYQRKRFFKTIFHEGMREMDKIAPLEP